ncbi:MAG TPA: galactokinase [Candidatus Latescibacteria bacterium]|nr:galactokinase [Gemmatimonadaceae bacterium]MDP6017009.1 galactokinase [Candidatus Latescibacterota bacterium]HJP32751.1 galactokinase [Candidatus Latescibacterota bacterium]
MITTRAPLRIPLGGGGTDLPSYYEKHGGFILSAGIDKYVFIQLNTLQVEDFVRVKYSETELVESVADIAHPLLRESLLYSEVGTGLEIGAMADVPGRTGMGSSGSFTVALLAALHEYKRQPLPRQQLAEAANHVEAVRCAQPAGKHDHYLAAFGGLTCLDIDTEGRVSVSPLSITLHTMEELCNSMVVFFTGIQRESFDILSQQEQDTLKGDEQVIDSLHEVKAIGLDIKKTLEDGDLDRFGELLHTHWETKKKRSSKMSNPDIDRWYDEARRSGALGGKLMGAGGGGFLMFYCPAQHRGALRERMAAQGLREMSFQFDAEGAKVLMNI